jgi:branched-chain amino acid transport system substrate-binding protein
MKNIAPQVFRIGLVAALVAAGAGFLAAAEKVVKIGFMAEITGTGAYIGQTTVPIMEDYVKQLNAKGGINGYQVKFVYYDTRNLTEDAIPVAKRLIEQDKCNVVLGPSFSGAGIPVASIADAAKCPVIATTASNINVTVNKDGKLHPYMFRICFIDPYQGYALADFAYKKLHARKVAFLTNVSSPYTVGVHQYFEKHWKELGGNVLTNEGYNEGETEFRAQLAKIKSLNPDLIVAAGTSYRDAGLYAQQARALGIKTPIIGADAWFADELLPLAGPDLEGCYMSTGASTESPEFAKYNAEVEKKFKIKPTIYTYFSMDTLMAAEWAIRSVTAKGQEPTRENLRSTLENMKDAQLFTSKVTMEKDTHNPHNKPLLIVKVHNSKFQLVETFQPK